MDKVDKQILKTLQKDGRKKNTELAKEAGLAPSTMLERVKKLEDKKIITRYRAVMDPEKLGFNAQGFVSISLLRHQVDNIQQLEKDKPIILYCASGMRSQQAAQALSIFGHAAVHDLGGLRNFQ